MKFYAINGEILPAEKAQIGVTDLALLRAFGIFDYFRFVNGKPVFMEDHLMRFQNSAKLMGLEIPFSKEELKRQILELAKTNEVVDAGIHMILTGGYSEDAFTPSKPNLIMLAKPFLAPSENESNDGVKLLFWKHIREIPEVKTINYIVPILSLKKRTEAGASDILYHDGNCISECSRSNIFIIKDEKLITPEKGILKGITRKHVLEVAKNVCEVELRDVTIEEVKNAKEVFVTSSSKRIMPVAQIDDHKIETGKPGDLTLKLSKLLEKRIKQLMEKSIPI